MTDWKRYFRRDILAARLAVLVPSFVAYAIVAMYTFGRIPGLSDLGCLGRDVLSCLPALVFSVLAQWGFSAAAEALTQVDVEIHPSVRTPRLSETRWQAWLRIYVRPVAGLLCLVIFVTHPLTCACIGTSFDVPDLLLTGVLGNTILLLLFLNYLYFTHYVFESFRLIKAEQQRSEFQHLLLRQRVDPHFLFNCLTSAAALTEVDPARARTFLGELASLYRHILGMSELWQVALDEEMDFVRAYLHLQQVRFAEGLEVTCDIDPSARYRSVLSGSVQMLVENALKHNMRTAESPLCIRVAATRDGVTVSNNVQRREPETSTGSGLRILTELHRRYGLSVRVVPEGGVFSVTVPFLA